MHKPDHTYEDEDEDQPEGVPHGRPEGSPNPGFSAKTARGRHRMMMMQEEMSDGEDE